eukprot:6193008-Pleurochrysis_carterae.AAC.1
MVTFSSAYSSDIASLRSDQTAYVFRRGHFQAGTLLAYLGFVLVCEGAAFTAVPRAGHGALSRTWRFAPFCSPDSALAFTPTTFECDDFRKSTLSA